MLLFVVLFLVLVVCFIQFNSFFKYLRETNKSGAQQLFCNILYILFFFLVFYIPYIYPAREREVVLTAIFGTYSMVL